MSETTPEPTAQTEPTPTTQPQAGSTPPWGDDDQNFDAEKAKKLIADLRADKEKLSAREFLTSDQKTKLAEYDRLVEASRSDLEKAQEAAAKVTPLQKENDRLKVAIEKGLVGDRADLVNRLHGDTLDDLRADADALLALFPEAGTAQVPRPNPAQGANGSTQATGAPQLTQNDLSRMTPEQIVEAQNKGQLNDLLGIR